MITSTVSPLLKIGLRVLGMWPGAPYSIVNCLILLSTILIMQYFQYVYIVEHFKMSELANLADGLPAAIAFSLTFLKLGSLLIHRRVLHRVLAAMDNDWRESTDVQQHLYIMTIKANVSHFCSNGLLSFTTIASILYMSGDYAVRLIYLTDYSNDTFRQFPLKTQFPFKTEQPSIFTLIFVILFIYVLINGCTIAVLNGLTITLVLHVSGQIDIICQQLKTISGNSFSYDSIASALGILIEKHNRVISFSENIEKLFSFIALMQVVCNTLGICCLGFIIIISVRYDFDVVLLIKSTVAYITIMIEAFIICFAGEYLSLKGKSIADAAYEMSWYDIPSNQGKIIIFIIMRSQKRLAITAGKMMDMSFETFTTIVKASASYMSLLNAMY